MWNIENKRIKAKQSSYSKNNIFYKFNVTSHVLLQAINNTYIVQFYLQTSALTKLALEFVSAWF